MTREESQEYRPAGYNEPPKVTVSAAAGASEASTGSGRYPQKVHELGRHADDPAARYRRPDKEIRDEIEYELTADATLDVSRVEVVVADGSVDVRGEVDSEDARRKIRDRVERIRGVERVTDGGLHADPHSGAGAEQRTGATGRY